MYLLIVLILISIFLKQFNKNNINLFQIFIEIINTLMNQSTQIFDTIIKSNTVSKARIISITILYCIWILTATIISQSFSSLLLKMYFNIKTYPIINTLNDIHNHKNIILMSNRDHF